MERTPIKRHKKSAFTSPESDQNNHKKIEKFPVD